MGPSLNKVLNKLTPHTVVSLPLLVTVRTKNANERNNLHLEKTNTPL